MPRKLLPALTWRVNDAEERCLTRTTDGACCACDHVRAELRAAKALVRALREIRSHAWHEREEMDIALTKAFAVLSRIERLTAPDEGRRTNG